MINDSQEEQAEASLDLKDQDGETIFKIGVKGEVFWKLEDKLVKAETSEDLGKAMALAILQIAGMDYIRLIEVYLGESTKAYKELLKKKLLESGTSKTLKKSELVKIMEEFKI